MKFMFGKITGSLFLFGFAVFLGSGAAAQTPTENVPRKEGAIWFEPFKGEVGGQAFDAEFGHLIVRENRRNPKSNLIELVFVRLKSTAAKPGFPVVYLDGGPGSSA